MLFSYAGNSYYEDTSLTKAFMKSVNGILLNVLTDNRKCIELPSSLASITFVVVAVSGDLASSLANNMR